MYLEGQLGHPPDGLNDRRAHGEIRHEVPIHHVHVDPVGPRVLHLGHLLTQAGKVGGEDRRSELHRAHVLDASKMRRMDASSVALNSASDCGADNPSTRAREKLATTP